MGTVKSVDFERSCLGKGIKVAALVLILAAAALATDHVVFFGSSAPAAAAAPASAAPLAEPTLDGFALPEHLRPTQADVGEVPPSF